MITLHNGGVYLLNGTSFIDDGHQAAAAIQAETDRKSTRLNSSHDN